MGTFLEWLGGIFSGAAGSPAAKMGLNPGEGISAAYSAALFQKQSSTALLAAPCENELVTVTLTLTLTPRLVIASAHGRFTPIAFDAQHRPAASVVGRVVEMGRTLWGTEPQSRMAGPSGLEPAVVLELTALGYAPIQLAIAESGARTFASWCADRG